MSDSLRQVNQHREQQAHKAVSFFEGTASWQDIGMPEPADQQAWQDMEAKLVRARAMLERVAGQVQDEDDFSLMLAWRHPQR